MARAHFGSLIKRENGTYMGRYRRHGRTYYTPTQRTKQAVRADLVKIEAAILAGEWEPPRKTRSGTAAIDTDQSWTVRAWYEAWYSRQEKAKRSPNSLRAYRSIFKVHILPDFGHLALTDVTPQVCTEKFQHVLETRSEETAKNVIRSFSACMGAAVEEGLIAENPVKVKGAMSKTPPKRNFHMITPTQLIELIDAFPEDTRAAGALGSWVSLRYGEIAALERADIDLETGVVHVTKSVKRAPNGGLSIGPPKSDAGYRSPSIPPQALPIIQYHLESFTAPALDALLFHRPRGPNGYLSDRVLRRDLNKAAMKVGLPPMRFHDLRHIGLTLFGRAGATTADLMARAGHADPATVAIYQHATATRDRELSSRMGGV
ncbi:site-specific integrase [Flaviflexus ciconiae]|uniref:Site-specific integrase n=1 Tax=Flaviflexus ciconiae TaxID=2496867 RepID=A0A3Q9G4V7_9ACTO|nr:site-specific integrase [Flaviflexus ciconiae]AZQ77689.1 site-specific integrase [Flaviflexus ciconiae]